MSNETNQIDNADATENSGIAQSVEDGNIPQQSTKTRGVKKPLIICACVAAIIAIAVLFATVISPSMKYNSAEEAYANGDYSLAEETYLALGDYKDAPEKAVLSAKVGHYTAAQSAFNSGDYSLAHDEFISAGDYSDASERAKEAILAGHYASAADAFGRGDFESAISEFDLADGYRDSAEKRLEAFYRLGLDYMDAGEYVSAANAFVDSQGFEDSDDKIMDAGKSLVAGKKYSDAIEVLGMTTNAQASRYIAYADGQISFSNQKYSDAEKLFADAGDIEDAGTMINASRLMQAEAYMEQGYLNTAKALYEAMPEGFSYNGVSSADRLESLDKHKDFVELCGQWKCNDMDASVRQTHISTGLWDQWDGDGYGYNLDITCVINDDDTVTMTAKASFWMYTNFSSLGNNLKYEDRSATFTYTGSSVPKNITNKYSFTNDYNEKLTISNKTFKLNCEVINKSYSINFNYTFKAFGTYDIFVKAY